MAQENVEIVKRFIGLANARDLEGLVELLAPDYVRYIEPDQPDAQVVRGRGAFAA
jgi:ketosteroid isomerase-like protein